MSRTDTDPAPPAPQAPGGRTVAPLRSHQARLGQGFDRLGPAERIALALSVVWLLLVLAFWLFLPAPAETGAATVILSVVGAVLPLALIWTAAITARNLQDLREEAERMKAVIEALSPQRSAGVAVPRPAEPEPSAERPVPAVERQGTFTSRRDGTATEPSADRRAALVSARPAPASEKEPSLALGTPAETPPLSHADLIRALNFPDNAEDREGFRALRRALEDHSTARLIRASQDVLNLLSQIDIFMDDLSPDLARPELWRRFAQGERGREIASVGGIRDRSVLALSAAQMRSDTIFRDTVHHFLRHFDRGFATFEQGATDQEIAALANTRTARAFMLLGRVTGIFD